MLAINNYSLPNATQKNNFDHKSHVTQDGLDANYAYQRSQAILYKRTNDDIKLPKTLLLEY